MNGDELPALPVPRGPLVLRAGRQQDARDRERRLPLDSHRIPDQRRGALDVDRVVLAADERGHVLDPGPELDGQGTAMPASLASARPLAPRERRTTNTPPAQVCGGVLVSWSGKRDLNPRPSAWERARRPRNDACLRLLPRARAQGAALGFTGDGPTALYGPSMFAVVGWTLAEHATADQARLRRRLSRGAASECCGRRSAGPVPGGVVRAASGILAAADVPRATRSLNPEQMGRRCLAGQDLRLVDDAGAAPRRRTSCLDAPAGYLATGCRRN